jgi:hypothetical protein
MAQKHVWIAILQKNKTLLIPLHRSNQIMLTIKIKVLIKMDQKISSNINLTQIYWMAANEK